MPEHPQKRRTSLLNHHKIMEGFRQRLAYTEALPQLAILGLISGIATGLVAVLFRLAIEWPLTLFLPDQQSENFEALPIHLRFALPMVGVMLLAIIFRITRYHSAVLGVSYVIERLHRNQAQLQRGHAVMQFVGGVLALMTGLPGGREGAAVHIGATCSSLLGQRLDLPNNSLRILVGCGAAAAIAASFNTPLAGVIFAMEVVLLEYTITGFIPVIIAAIAGAVVSHFVFGNAPAFQVPELQNASLWEFPWLAVCGVIVGLIATALLRLHVAVTRLRRWHFFVRFLLAGLAAAIGAVLVPESMGISYDTLELALLGEAGLQMLLLVAICKLVLSTSLVALGLPSGIISPLLVLGGCLGGSLGIAANLFNLGDASSAGLYATIGMGAMMAAVLNAPLAALIAILELTSHSNLLLPSMLVIVVATMTTRITSGLPGLFLIGYDPSRYASPIFQMLSRAGVTSLMSRKLVTHSRNLPWRKCKPLLAQRPEWIVIEDVGEPKYILRPTDLAHFLEEQDTSLWEPDHLIDLREIPGQRWRLFPIHPRATLQEALVLLKKQNGNAVYVTRPATPLISDVAGVITRTDLDNFYQI